MPTYYFREENDVFGYHTAKLEKTPKEIGSNLKVVIQKHGEVFVELKELPPKIGKVIKLFLKN